jgi:hypothetical protein
MGSVDSDGYCEVATQSALPLAYARIGNGGTLANVNLYESCSAGAAWWAPAPSTGGWS